MRHDYFEIRNFKGIEHIRFNLDSHPRSQVYTLVGLNESGKTTVLEALDFFSLKGEELQHLQPDSYSAANPHDAIPKSKKGIFDERISIKVRFVLDDNDNDKINKYLKDNHDLELSEPIEKFEVEEYYQFEDSLLTTKNAQRTWSLNPNVHKSTLLGRRSKKTPQSFILSNANNDEQWQGLVTYIKTLLPSILYFPNFLFDFPDRIYLEDPSKDPELHRAYRNILQDVLHAIDAKYDLQKHITERLKSENAHDKEALRSVLTKMVNHISTTVFRSWNNIFQKQISQKQIVVEYGADTEGYYLELRLREGDDNYKISERSLGFRWFFAFLLLTQYRRHRKDAAGNVLFLFDEPASNLHSTAQRQLRESFDKLGDCSVIYTTHSHHLINPAWLEGTYVVKNEGLDYQDEDDYLAKNTNVTLHKYRDFVAQHPDQETYFKPILDVLEYRPSDLENIPDVVMVEGKTDFYSLKYVQDKVLGQKKKLNLLPGNGAGSLEHVIRLYIGWGRNFIVLLDADGAGQKEKARYADIFGSLIDNRIFTLIDIHDGWTKKGIEKIFEEADCEVVQREVFPTSGALHKTHFNRALQELYLMNRQVEISKKTQDNFKTILSFCAQKLNENSPT